MVQTGKQKSADHTSNGESITAPITQSVVTVR